METESVLFPMVKKYKLSKLKKDKPPLRVRIRDRSFWARLLFDAFLVFLAVTVIPVLIFRVVNPPTTPLMWIRWVESGYQDKVPREIKKWRPLKEISPRLIRAVITSEDQKFFTHHGFDWEAVGQAMQVNLESKRKFGASTISMQTARNVFLWQNRDWVRKGLEAYFTVLIEWFWGKERILEVYFNIIEWGDGVFGCEAAARKYFKHSIKRASPAESAWMAAILPNPRKWSRPTHRRWIKKRQARILHTMSKVHLPRLAT
jgi:monofunctional biosynthetic peptidoglycan transglycosylase